MDSSLAGLEGKARTKREGPGGLASAPCGLGQKLLDPDALPLLADQSRPRWGGVGHLEGGAKGTAEGGAVAGGEGFALLLELEGGGSFKQRIRVYRTTTTLLFRNGNSQAVRIPAELAYERSDLEL
jgi:hypothetical protein